MKSILNLIVLAMLLSASTASAQNVRVLKGIKSYSGNVAEWGVKKQGGIYPAKGWVFYAIDQAVLVIVPQKKANPKGLKAFMIQNPELQRDLFGTTYTEYAKKKKKKRKKGSGSGSLVLRCGNKPGCMGTCQAVMTKDCPDCPEVFLRCTGNCCEDGSKDGLPEIDSSGTSGEFIY